MSTHENASLKYGPVILLQDRFLVFDYSPKKMTIYWAQISATRKSAQIAAAKAQQHLSEVRKVVQEMEIIAHDLPPARAAIAEVQTQLEIAESAAKVAKACALAATSTNNLQNIQEAADEAQQQQARAQRAQVAAAEIQQQQQVLGEEGSRLGPIVWFALLGVAVIVVAFVFFMFRGVLSAPTATFAPTQTPTATSMPTSTPIATFAPTQTPIATFAPTQTPTATFAPTQTPTATSMPTSTPIATPMASLNDNANFRSGPGRYFDIPGGGQYGNSVQIVGVSSDDKWYLLDSGYWVFHELVTNSPENVEVIDSSDGGYQMKECPTENPTLGDAVITFPGVNRPITGVIAVTGRVNRESLNYWELRLNGEQGKVLAKRYEPESGVLFNFDSALAPNGKATLWLRAVDKKANYSTCEVTIVIQNGSLGFQGVDID